MNDQIPYRLFLLLILLLAVYTGSHAQVSLTLSGSGWIYNVPVSDVTEAGLDFTGTYNSATNQVLISVSGVNKGKNKDWTLYINKSDIGWDNTVSIYVVRTSDGIASNPATIAGGTTLQQITDFSTMFFSGSRDRSDIAIQYQLMGVSVVLPAKSYSTTIIYTVTSP